MKKCFIVLGMHRSGTSLIAKGLNNEISMGRILKGAKPGSEYGLYENANLLKLNNEILKNAGGSWKQPPTENAILESGSKLPIAQTIKEESKGFEFWGWKDPRNVLTIKCYLLYIENPHFICVFRDPLEIGKSLNKRGDMGIQQGIELAKEYNRRLLNLMNELML